MRIKQTWDSFVLDLISVAPDEFLSRAIDEFAEKHKLETIAEYADGDWFIYNRFRFFPIARPCEKHSISTDLYSLRACSVCTEATIRSFSRKRSFLVLELRPGRRICAGGRRVIIFRFTHRKGV